MVQAFGVQFLKSPTISILANKLLNAFVPGRKLTLYKEDVSSSVAYAERVRRTNPYLHTLPAVDYAIKSQPALYIDYASDGRVSLQLEIGHPAQKEGA